MGGCPADEVIGRSLGIIYPDTASKRITEWRRHEQSRRMAAEEIVHGPKKLLAVSAAQRRRRTAASTGPGDFGIRFGGRIKSLATSTGFLTAGNRTTVSLAALVAPQTVLFATAGTAPSETGPGGWPVAEADVIA